MNIRNECVICGGDKLNDIFTLNMPTFMGVVDSPKTDLCDMTFTECDSCGNVQIDKILPPEVVYQNNHNIGVVGETWANHYKELCDFIRPHIGNRNVLEISDPSAKIAKSIAKDCNKWYIIEPNPDMDSYDNVIFIEEFFDSNFKLDDRVDVIVHSHFFEHTYEPNKFLSDCYDALHDDGEMFMSIPNLQHLLKSGVSPNGILHFEHTFLYDMDKLFTMLNNNGFDVLDMHNFNNHSIFMRLTKNHRRNIEFKRKSYRDSFIRNFETHKEVINDMNEKIKDSENVYLYGSHVTSQFYLFNGLDTTNIKGILDNSPAKQGKYLFGTELKVFSPDNIDYNSNVVILCSHMGIYFEEIKSQLMKLSPNITIL